MLEKFTFTGCSLTNGQGLNSKDERYSNLVAKYFVVELNNIAVDGKDNEQIFLDALNAIYFGTQTKLFVQWSSLNRKQFRPEPDKHVGIFPNNKAKIQRYKSFYCSKEEMQTFSDVFFKLNGEYCQLLKLINYCNILEEAAKDKCDIIFINGLLPWKSDIARPELVEDYARDLEEYTKEILLFDVVEIEEFRGYFHVLCKQFKTLNRTLWFNIFSELTFMQRDNANDGLHPGPKSQQVYATKLIDYITENY
jgi:hypothetical protein